jgi:hypothetical protein
MGRGTAWSEEEIDALAAIVNQYIGSLSGYSISFFSMLFQLGRIPHILSQGPNPRTATAMCRYLANNRYNIFF